MPPIFYDRGIKSQLNTTINKVPKAMPTQKSREELMILWFRQSLFTSMVSLQMQAS
jgi:hypothetical protein